MHAALSILAITAGADDDEAVIAVAADVARRNVGSLLTVDVFAEATPALALPTAGTVAAAAALRASLADDIRTMRAGVAELVRKHTCAGSAHSGAVLVRLAERSDSAWEGLMRELPLADLVVLGQSRASAFGSWSGPLGESLMSAKAPVLVARGPAPIFGQPAAIAWDGSLEAGHAVRAAVPLLQDASEVFILQHLDDANTGPGSQAEPARLQAYLSAHGVTAGRLRETRGRRVGHALLEAARDVGAALLVAGAYGHSRIGEALWGGATRTLLHAEEGPHLFVAH